MLPEMLQYMAYLAIILFLWRVVEIKFPDSMVGRGLLFIHG